MELDHLKSLVHYSAPPQTPAGYNYMPPTQPTYVPHMPTHPPADTYGHQVKRRSSRDHSPTPSTRTHASGYTYYEPQNYY